VGYIKCRADRGTPTSSRTFGVYLVGLLLAIFWTKSRRCRCWREDGRRATKWFRSTRRMPAVQRVSRARPTSAPQPLLHRHAHRDAL